MTAYIPNAYGAPDVWDRRGLPGWTYRSQALFDLERSAVFLTHWQLAGHTADLPNIGDWISFDLLGERAVVMRGQDGVIRAFHNLCRHRGARVVDGASGTCKSAIVCPFHGWVYNLDGTLRGAAQPESFGQMDRSKFRLKPIEMQIWHGFIFLRFAPGPQADVALWLAPYAVDFAAFRLDTLEAVKTAGWCSDLPVNWKSVRDVDNEGYHVPLAHPALQELYGRSYSNIYHGHGLAQSNASFGDRPGRRWSVRNYVKMSPVHEWQPPHLQKAWVYYGLFPNTVITFTPEAVMFYQDIPISPNQTLVTGRTYSRVSETRQMRAARYLAMRIDRETSAEDQQLSIWSNESMKSSAFDDFHLSDLEYGVRLHHDMLRDLVPVMTLDQAPPENSVAAKNLEMSEHL